MLVDLVVWLLQLLEGQLRLVSESWVELVEDQHSEGKELPSELQERRARKGSPEPVELEEWLSLDLWALSMLVLDLSPFLEVEVAPTRFHLER